MARHKKFPAHQFLDKFQEREEILRAFVGRWAECLGIDAASLDIPGFENLLGRTHGEGMDEMLEALYSAHDLCTERGHEDLVEACRQNGYAPDPDEILPVECLSLKVRTENEEAFGMAYAMNSLREADRFTIHRAKAPAEIDGLDAAAGRFEEELVRVFRDEKRSERVLVRKYREGTYANFIVYHEKRTRTDIVLRDEAGRTRVGTTTLRPAQQDFVSYDARTGQVEVEARLEKEENALRRCFAGACFGDPEHFEAEGAANRFLLARIAEDDFRLDVDEGHAAALREIHFRLKQRHGPIFVVKSRDALDTLELNRLRRRLKGGEIRRAVFHFTFPDDNRGKRVEISGTNRIRFRRATHAEDVFRYLTAWGIAVG